VSNLYSCPYDAFSLYIIDWLEDKLAAEGFALTGIYWPKSMIPIEIWRASPNTTNGNEQLHRNINRDGVKLTLYSGVMRGLNFDHCRLAIIQVTCKYDIPTCDQLPTAYQRASRALLKSGMYSFNFLY